VQVLWVKGSGGDIGSMKLDGFATLYMTKLMQLRAQYRGLDQEDAMVEALGHTIFNLNPRAPSIDTWLHGFVPKAHVDHVHSDAVIAIAASADQVRLTQEIFGGELGYLPWQRPGIDLGIKLGRMAEENPKLKGVVLGQHGLFTWADTAKDCYLLTLEMINKAAVWLEANVKRPVFGGEKVASLAAADRKATARRLMPLIRGRISAGRAYGGAFHRCARGAGVRELSCA
jgi:rhamnose utilization protein RhaD (predicted bifunctional aldolase and dehydrogenase)